MAIKADLVDLNIVKLRNDKSSHENHTEREKIFRQKMIDQEYKKLIDARFKDLHNVFEKESGQHSNDLSNIEDYYRNQYFQGNLLYPNNINKSNQFENSKIPNKIPINNENVNNNLSINVNLNLNFSLKELQGLNQDNIQHYEPKMELKEIKDDDIAKIDKLSLISMGARYELLKANQQLVDFAIVS